MNGVKCFFLEPTPEASLFLRRYVLSEDEKCPLPAGYHNAFVAIPEKCTWTLNDNGCFDFSVKTWPTDDPRWPTQCACGFEFGNRGPFQLYHEVQYRRTDTGEITTLQDAPPGAMWFADWMLSHRPDVDTTNNAYRGPDGHCLYVRCPDGHDWCVDGPCSNCTMPNDWKHKCWVRHGDPRKPETVTVDKNGYSCQAGAGSIATGKWHGFLRNGILVPC